MYQWKDCTSPTDPNSCSSIGGATGSTYTAAVSDVGLYLRVQEIASNQGGPGQAVLSPASALITPAVPTNAGPPVIAGTAAQAQTLTEQHGTWNEDYPAPLSYSYQWEDCNTAGAGCVAIPGATAASYTPSAGDIGHTLIVVETAANSGGSSAPAASAPTAPVVSAPAPPVQALTQAAKPITTNSATVRAQLQTQGLGVSWQFVYGQTTAYNAGTPVQTIAAGGPSVVLVSRTLTNLKPNTKYHYRIVETAAPGPYAPGVTADGRDLTFTTNSLGKIVLGHTKLEVSAKGVVQVPLECKSTLTCVDRFSITKTAEIGRGASRHFGSVLCDTNVNRVPAGKSLKVSITLTKGCLALLQAASGHRMTATFTTRPRSGQLGLIETITLVAAPSRKTSGKGA